MSFLSTVLVDKWWVVSYLIIFLRRRSRSHRRFPNTYPLRLLTSDGQLVVWYFCIDSHDQIIGAPLFELEGIFILQQVLSLSDHIVGPLKSTVQSDAEFGTQGACLDSLHSPLSIITWHVAPGRYAWYSPHFLSTELLGSLCQCPSSISSRRILSKGPDCSTCCERKVLSPSIQWASPLPE